MLASQDQVIARYLQPQSAVSQHSIAAAACSISIAMCGKDVQTSLDIVACGCVFLARNCVSLQEVASLQPQPLQDAQLAYSQALATCVKLLMRFD